MTWMLFSSAVMSQIIISNDHHFEVLWSIIHLPWYKSILCRGWCLLFTIMTKLNSDVVGKCTTSNTTPTAEQNKKFSLSFSWSRWERAVSVWTWICMKLDRVSVAESCILFTRHCWMGAFCRGVSKPPRLSGGGTHLVLSLPPMLLWSSRLTRGMELEMCCGHTNHSQLPLPLSLEYQSQAESLCSHPSCCELPRAEGCCPSGCSPPATCPSISSLKT